MTEEQKVQKQITDLLESEGCYVVKVINATKKGVPDLLASYKGQFLGIEVKKAVGIKPSALQQHNINLINDSGGYAICAGSLQQVREFLHLIDVGEL